MTAARPPRDVLSIGAVLAQLRPDFPDITISKIRFLEAEGLISPARTESGYRQFSAADVARLRFVLSAQRDRYLPLKVIREQLAAAELSSIAPSRPLAAVPPPPETTVSTPASHILAALRSGPHTDESQPLTRAELAAAADIDAVLLAELEQYGLLAADEDGRYAPDSVVVAATVRSLTEFGIEPRHLRAFRAAADREVGLLAQIVAPLQRNRDPATRARADQMSQELVALAATLHAVLVKAGLRASAGG